ncbi:hypothetical protein [Ectobacillus polymachus]|uniref:hypothetical protein n=1 Tax=Ectobacillus polymachus TaxID=1508806 RepID=UPI003A883636
MRNSDRANRITNSANGLLPFQIQENDLKERSFPAMELASEYGVSIQDVKNVKKHLSRS